MKRRFEDIFENFKFNFIILKILFQGNKDRLKKPNVIVLLADDFGIGDFQVFKKFPTF